jgi:hypothetical protein
MNNYMKQKALDEAYNQGYNHPEEGCPEGYDEDLQEQWLKGANDLKIEALAYAADKQRDEKDYEQSK